MSAPTVGSARYPSPRTVTREQYLSDRDKLAARMAAAELRLLHQAEYECLVAVYLGIIDRRETTS